MLRAVVLSWILPSRRHSVQRQGMIACRGWLLLDEEMVAPKVVWSDPEVAANITGT